MSALWGWLNAQAGWLFLGGLAMVVCWNGYKWRQDRALAWQLRGRELQPVQLKSTPKVSVLVAAWNEAHIIREHIESFLGLGYPNKELVLCAGGGDRTYEMAREYAEGQVVVLQQRAREGKQAALRRCLERASGEIVFLTDADCIVSNESFTATLEPIVYANEAAATGAVQPLLRQRRHPLVVYQWAIQLYGLAQTSMYSRGLQGANCAVLRSALERCGGFDAVVRTGTDYHLARQLLGAGFCIRAVPGSAMQTEYPQRLSDYVRQNSRWLRNLFLHGRAHGDSSHTRHALLTATIGVAGLVLPLIGLLLGALVWSPWLWLVTYSLSARLRYMAVARTVGVTLSMHTLVQLPLFLGADWLAAVRATVEACVPGRRWHW